jgi:acetylornithine deacetylase/succinyl-diaminopimelate desuccinylase-like protein
MPIEEDRLVTTLQDLIRIPSITTQEHEIASFVREEMEALGHTVYMDEEVDNVYVEIEGSDNGKTLMLNSHLDTVPAMGYEGDPYAGIKDGDKIIGLGASDCKAGVASMMEIARTIDEKKINGKLVLAFTVAEEAVLEGTRLPKGSMYAAEKFKADGCIILEPTLYEGKPRISAGCRGRMILDLAVKGKSTHSSRPHTGKNAIEEAVRLVNKLKEHDLLSGNYFGKELPETLSIVKINSDSPATNIIPSLCTLTVDYRTLPGRKEVVDKITKAIGDSEVDTEVKIPYFFPGYFLGEENPFTDSFQTEVSKVFENPVETQVALGRADTEYFYRNGIPALEFGPGENHQCHKPEEYALISGMVKATQSVDNFIGSFLC